MKLCPLGTSGIRVSTISFGAGPISGLMVGDDSERQRSTVQTALDAGVNWFDTAAKYGEGLSEVSLGAALNTANVSGDFHIATKVRLMPDQLANIRSTVRQSFEESLERLGTHRVTLLQLHNSVTANRGDLPTSLTVDDVLGKDGVVPEFQRLRDEGLVQAFGFTGLGERSSVSRLVRSGAFTSAQIPLSLLTPFAGEDRSAGSIDVDYEELAAECSENGVGVIAIRVLAGGALSGQPPSPYTFKTKFFPLDLFERDQRRVARILRQLPDGMTPAEATVRFVSHLPGVSTSLLGFASPIQIEQATAWANRGPLDADILRTLRQDFSAGSQ